MVTGKRGGAVSAKLEISKILQLDNWQEIFFETIAHIQRFLDSNGFHEDYIRDACELMVSVDGPFSTYLAGAFEFETALPYSNDASVSFDVLADFCGQQDDALRFSFLMNFLVAIRHDNDGLPGILAIERWKWKSLIEKSFLFAMNSLESSPFHR